MRSMWRRYLLLYLRRWCFRYSNRSFDRFSPPACRQATVTAIQPPGRYGALNLEDSLVHSFRRSRRRCAWINGGYFVPGTNVFENIEGMRQLGDRSIAGTCCKSQLAAYEHRGFWQAWIRYATRINWNPSGLVATRRGKCGMKHSTRSKQSTRPGHGHTGFKGSWLALWLQMLEATSLEYPSTSNVAKSLDLLDSTSLTIGRYPRCRRPCTHRKGNATRDSLSLGGATIGASLHKDPLATWSTNVVGTANLLEACRETSRFVRLWS